MSFPFKRIIIIVMPLKLPAGLLMQDWRRSSVHHKIKPVSGQVQDKAKDDGQTHGNPYPSIYLDINMLVKIW